MPFHEQRQNGECPLGGNFYVCSREMGGFSGCCMSDPCVPGGSCPKEKDRTPGRGGFTSKLRSSSRIPTDLDFRLCDTYHNNCSGYSNTNSIRRLIQDTASINYIIQPFVCGSIAKQ